MPPGLASGRGFLSTDALAPASVVATSLLPAFALAAPERLDVCALTVPVGNWP